ncbi:unnamed protein product [Arctogadus glacialis]
MFYFVGGKKRNVFFLKQRCVSLRDRVCVCVVCVYIYVCMYIDAVDEEEEISLCCVFLILCIGAIIHSDGEIIVT